MDDDKVNPSQNQPGDSSNQQPIQEVVPVEETDKIQPEEVPPEVASAAPEDMSGVSEIPPPESPPPVYEENKTKYFFIIGVGVFFLLLLIFFISVLFGKSSSKVITLTYWGLWEDREVYAPLIQAYEQKNPKIKINYQQMSPQDYRDKLIARSKNGQGPDIFRFHNTWLPEIGEVAAPMPSNIMSNTEFEKTFYKIHSKDLKVGDHYFGLPLEIDGLVLAYNDDLFKKIGITTPPTNWDEVTDVVNKFASAVDKDGKPITSAIALGTSSNVDNFSDILGLLLVQNGADLKKLDSAEAAGALESYRKFAEPPNNIWNDSLPPSVTAFAQEKVAMIIVPSWELINIKNTNPDLKMKVTTIPAVPGATPVSLASYWVEGVSRESKQQLEAWKFLRFLVDKDNLTKLYEAESKTRLFGEPYSRVDLASLLVQNDYIGPVLKQADNYVSLPVISRTYDNGLNDEIITYLGNAINQTVEGVSYSEAMLTAKKGVDQVLTKYKVE